jgi:S-adenosylmethionine synthetase
MNRAEYLFTSESVTEGHPDKMADQISDAVLDALLSQDSKCRVACETLLKTGMVLISGEITTDGYADLPEVARGVIRDIGYDNSTMGFDWNTCAVLSAVSHQSPDIARGVDKKSTDNGDLGAGDQGMMFGYATDETEELMPLPIVLAHRITRRLAEVRHSGALPFLRPDGKSQVTVRYLDGRPQEVTTVVVSTQHSEDIEYGVLCESIIEEVVKSVIPERFRKRDMAVLVNPTGRFVVGGPAGDCGLTGRKIIVDTYGGWARHGGGCFSGKDPSKVDRSAAYAARYIAKNIVAAGLAKQVEVQLAYAIGVAEPVSLMVDTFGTGRCDETELPEIIRRYFPVKPFDIISQLDLLRPIFRSTAVGGHFGRLEPQFSWESLDRVDVLQNEARIKKDEV